MKLVSLLLLAAVASARFTPVTQYGTKEDRIEGEYVIKFENDARAEFEQFKNAKDGFLRNHVDVREFGDYMGFGGALTPE